MSVYFNYLCSLWLKFPSPASSSRLQNKHKAFQIPLHFAEIIYLPCQNYHGLTAINTLCSEFDAWGYRWLLECLVYFNKFSLCFSVSFYFSCQPPVSHLSISMALKLIPDKRQHLCQNTLMSLWHTSAQSGSCLPWQNYLLWQPPHSWVELLGTRVFVPPSLSEVSPRDFHQLTWNKHQWK